MIECMSEHDYDSIFPDIPPHIHLIVARRFRVQGPQDCRRGRAQLCAGTVELADVVVMFPYARFVSQSGIYLSEGVCSKQWW
jgi:hypothetical protein